MAKVFDALRSRLSSMSGTLLGSAVLAQVSKHALKVYNFLVAANCDFARNLRSSSFETGTQRPLEADFDLDAVNSLLTLVYSGKMNYVSKLLIPISELADVWQRHIVQDLILAKVPIALAIDEVLNLSSRS